MWGYIPNTDRLFESWTRREIDDRTCMTIAFDTSAYFKVHSVWVLVLFKSYLLQMGETASN